jgi:hypothetical protein
MSLNSYIAGLNLHLTETQVLNGLALASTGVSFYLSWPGSDFKNKANREAGQPVEMPTRFKKKAQAVTVVHGLGMLAPTVAFGISLPLNRFVMPGWLARFSLAPAPLPIVYYSSRAAGCMGCIGIGIAMVSVFKHLGSQWNYLGVSYRLL